MKEEWLEGSVSKLSEAIPVGSKTQNLYVGQCYLKRLGEPNVKINRWHAQAYFKGTHSYNESDDRHDNDDENDNGDENDDGSKEDISCSTFSPGSHETC